MRSDLEIMFYEYAVPCIVLSVVLWFMATMMCAGLDKPEVYTLTEQEREAIVQSWDN